MSLLTFTLQLCLHPAGMGGGGGGLDGGVSESVG